MFSQKFFRNNFFYGYLGMSRDMVPNIRIRYVSILPLVRHIFKLPGESSFLTKLIDATEPLATQDADGDVRKALTNFYSIFGLLNSPNCCKIPAKDTSGVVTKDSFGLDTLADPNHSRKTSSDSESDWYLVQKQNLENLASDEIDKEKEDLEFKQQFFLLDPNRKRAFVPAKKGDTIKKITPIKAKGQNKMQQLDDTPKDRKASYAGEMVSNPKSKTLDWKKEERIENRSGGVLKTNGRNDEIKTLVMDMKSASMPKAVGAPVTQTKMQNKTEMDKRSTKSAGVQRI